MFKIGARHFGEEVEAIDLMPYFYTDKYDRNEAFRIKMRPRSHMSIEGGMVAGLRPQVVVSSSNTTTLGNGYGDSGAAHPNKYILTYTPDAFLNTLQTDGYVVGDSFTIINKSGDSVGVVNNTQADIYNTIDGNSYGYGKTIRVLASTTRVFHMVWTDSGFILYK